VVSLLLVVHLTAVVTAPLSVAPSSELFGRMFGFFRPYLQAANLNHGYRFFGPDPGPGHHVRYVVERADGGLVEGRFPDRERHWPRLLYHRHFMLAERVPAAPLESPWIQAYARSYARHLLVAHDGRRVTLHLGWDDIPPREEFLRGMRLDDQRLRGELPRPLLIYRESAP
jgi:hypothetical protein